MSKPLLNSRWFAHDGFNPAVVTMLCAVLLSWWGILSIGSGMQLLPQVYELAVKQLWVILPGVLLMVCCALVPFGFFRRNAFWLALLSLVGLYGLFVFGVRINGMLGWYDVGIGSLQPSEFAKVFFVLALVATLSSKASEKIKFALLVLFLFAWGFPIAMQPDFGTLALYFAAGLTIYFLSGAGISRLAMVAAILGVVAALLICSHPYMVSRLSEFFRLERDYFGGAWHLRQFELAIAEGGIWGVKMGRTVWSSGYLPFSYNDSVLATLVECVGILGATVLFLLYGGMLYGLYLLGRRAKKCPNKLFIFGIFAFFGIQALLHILVNSGILPTTGVTLPFVSYGGSSLISSFLMVGMAISAAFDDNEIRVIEE